MSTPNSPRPHLTLHSLAELVTDLVPIVATASGHPEVAAALPVVEKIGDQLHHQNTFEMPRVESPVAQPATPYIQTDDAGVLLPSTPAYDIGATNTIFDPVTFRDIRVAADSPQPVTLEYPPAVGPALVGNPDIGAVARSLGVAPLTFGGTPLKIVDSYKDSVFAAIQLNKQLRKDLDEKLQQLKIASGASTGTSQLIYAGARRSRERSVVITKLQEAIMWLGQDLKAISEENPELNLANPYPQSKNPDSTVVHPTADGVKL